MNNYVKWLQKQGVRLFISGNTYWRIYQGALIPASAAPCFAKLNLDESQVLLQESGAWFLRYASDPCEQETSWWYIICDSYDPKKLSSNTRSKINRGNRRCSVRKINADWLAEHGYPCYLAAYQRYENAMPVSQEVFYQNIVVAQGDIFEYWGVFFENKLAGYCQCIVEDMDVCTSVIKYDPTYLKYYSSYALMNRLINHYVVNRGMVVNNGSRSIAHDTNMQDFLLKLGFRKQFCYLNVIYQLRLKLAIQFLFPLQSIFAKLPDQGLVHKVKSLLFQEELRRLCQ
jgi:hypothetical protein